MPINPEEEDDVVPDQTAAFGITRAMSNGGRGTARERGWRDVDSLGDLLRGAGLGEGVDATIEGRGGLGGRRQTELGSVVGAGGGVTGRGGTPLR